jgi:hypothetical protein
MPAKPTVLVLGAGIQGACAALALYSRGYNVTLIDRMPGVMLRASLRGEGKIHLGFVYANDATFETSALLLRAALNFSPLLDSWLGTPLNWRALTSAPFLYLIARDSMLTPDAIRAHYERLQDSLNELVTQGERASYLGMDLREGPLWRTAPPDTRKWFSQAHIEETIETQELALNGRKFRELVCARLRSCPEIKLRLGHQIETIERTHTGFCVAGERADGSRWSESAQLAVNCLWDGRLALDERLGIFPQRPFVMRLKYRVLGVLPDALANLPSATMVLGRYGDIVRYSDAPTYLSWYPACLRGWSTNVTPPTEWDAVCAGNPPTEIADAVARETLDAFEKIVPNLRHTRVQTVDGGVIHSWGETDIDDAASALHKRYEIGFTTHDGYYSVDTGKLTCAPWFAHRLAEHVDTTA